METEERRELGLLASAAVKPSVPYRVSQNLMETPKDSCDLLKDKQPAARPLDIPVNPCLLDTRGPHKKVALQLSPAGQYFNGAFRIWGAPENSVLKQENTGNWGLLAPVSRELFIFVVLATLSCEGKSFTF